MKTYVFLRITPTNFVTGEHPVLAVLMGRLALGAMTFLLLLTADARAGSPLSQGMSFLGRRLVALFVRVVGMSSNQEDMYSSSDVELMTSPCMNQAWKWRKVTPVQSFDYDRPTEGFTVQEEPVEVDGKYYCREHKGDGLY